MQSIDMLVEAAQEFLHQTAAFLPRLLLALLVVAAGWLFAKAVRFTVERALRAINFNVLTERAGTDNFLKQAGMRGDTTTLFGLVAFARSLEKFEARHFRVFILLVILLTGFGVVLYVGGNHLGDVVGPKLQELEAASSL